MYNKWNTGSLVWFCSKKTLWAELKTNLKVQTLLQNRNVICQSALLLNKYLGVETYLKKSGSKAGRTARNYIAFVALIWQSIWACVYLFWLHSTVSLILSSNLIPIDFIVKWWFSAMRPKCTEWKLNKQWKEGRKKNHIPGN